MKAIIIANSTFKFITINTKLENYQQLCHLLSNRNTTD